MQALSNSSEPVKFLVLPFLLMFSLQLLLVPTTQRILSMHPNEYDWGMEDEPHCLGLCPLGFDSASFPRRPRPTGCASLPPGQNGEALTM